MIVWFNNRKFLLSVVIIEIGLLALTYYQFQLGMSKNGSAMRLTDIESQQQWTVGDTPLGNIFNPDRTLKHKLTDNAKESEKDASNQKDAYRLMGVMTSGKKKEALFSFLDQSIRVSIGDTLASFGVLKSIKDNQVTIISDDGQVYEWGIFPISASPKKEDNNKS